MPKKINSAEARIGVGRRIERDGGRGGRKATDPVEVEARDAQLRLSRFRGHPDRQISVWQGRMPSWVQRVGSTPRSSGSRLRIW